MNSFTPSNVIDMSKEKEWASSLGQWDEPVLKEALHKSFYQTGMMDWDNTRIVFTKRTLIEFLR